MIRGKLVKKKEKQGKEELKVSHGKKVIRKKIQKKNNFQISSIQVKIFKKTTLTLSLNKIKSIIYKAYRINQILFQTFLNEHNTFFKKPNGVKADDIFQFHLPDKQNYDCY